jgi:actin-like ATPase involved in cell morphogenesis/uncharacterized protein (DUF697 family)
MADSNIKWHIGIDIGTTNSSITYFAANLTDPQPVKFDGDKALRSALLFNADGDKVVEIGKAVYDHPEAAEFPDRVRAEFKLGFGRKYDAAQCTHIIASELMKGLARILPDPITPETCLTNIGAPADWLNTEPERVALLKQVVTKAGFPNVEVVAEPVAAMLYHAFVGEIPFSDQPQNCLIIDVGGGTTDLAFVRIHPHGKRMEVINTHGYNLGGKDFDHAILENVILKKFWVGAEPTPSQKLDLLKISQEVKEGFSEAVQKGNKYAKAFRSKSPGLPNPISLSWEEFNDNEVAGMLVERFGIIIEEGMASFIDGAGSLEKIILTGGSARWHFVRDQLEFLKSSENVLLSPDPDLTIAKGLALARTGFKPPQKQVVKATRTWIGNIAVSSSNVVKIAQETLNKQEAKNFLDKIILNELTLEFKKSREECKKQADKVTLLYTSGGTLGAAAFAQIPGVASAGLPFLETKLIVDIAHAYGYSIDTKQALTIGGGMVASGMVLKMGALELAGMVPMLGNLVKGGVAASFIYGLGQAALKFFEMRRFGGSSE